MEMRNDQKFAPEVAPDFRNREYNEKARNAIFSGSGIINYCIFRAGRKYYNMGEISGFQAHMKREMKVLNADENQSKYNQIIVGADNIKKDVDQFLDGVYRRKTAVLARELLLTASHEFFKYMPEEQINRWIMKNAEFLKSEFQDNLRFACVHKDEKTIHIHALVTFRVPHERWGFQSCHKQFFDGKDKLRGYQDRYYEAMKEFSLARGVKYSKAKHVDIKRYYGVVNKPTLECTPDEAMRKAQLLDTKNKQLKGTIQAIKLVDESILKENEALKNQIKELTNNTELNKTVLKYLKDKYRITDKVVNEAVSAATNQNKSQTKL